VVGVDEGDMLLVELVVMDKGGIVELLVGTPEDVVILVVVLC
jgi:hypothetical protein